MKLFDNQNTTTRFQFFILVFVSFTLFSQVSYKQQKEIPYLVIFSLDGFRWDYPEACHTPTLDSIEKHGVRAKAIIPSFPTLTFPNHYTLATGLYPGKHGIVHNTFYDKTLQRTYTLKDRNAISDSIFYGGIPLWNVMQMHNIKTGTCFWVGSEAPINSMHANYWMKYNWRLPYKSRIDTVINWLKKPGNHRPHLIMAYFSEPDYSGHKYGPLTPQTNAQIEMLDSVLHYFFTRLKKLPMQNKVNVIVLSDHGMARVDSLSNIFLHQHIKETWVKRIDCYSPVVMIEPAKQYEDSIYQAVSAIDHLKIFRRKNIPEQWQLSDTNRIDKLMLVAENGYMPRWKQQEPFIGGMHGYDNKNKDMNAIFYAIGPAFKKGHSHPAFRNVDLYPLVQQIFGLKNITKSDGKLHRVEQMLKISD